MLLGLEIFEIKPLYICVSRVLYPHIFFPDPDPTKIKAFPDAYDL